MSEDFLEQHRKRVRGLQCGESRSADFRAGHRLALRAAITWLHEEAKQMNDPHAKRLLDSAAFGLGSAARNARDEDSSA